jgi:hypothetical protein
VTSLTELLNQLEEVSAQAAAAEWDALPALCARRAALTGELAAHPLRQQAPEERMRRIAEAGDAAAARIEAWRAEWAVEAAALDAQAQLALRMAATAPPEGEDRALL